MALSKRPNTLRANAPKVSGSVHGTHSEKRVARSVGARLNPGSGSKRGAKGDSEMAAKAERLPILMESKSTIHETMSVDLGWLVKIANEAKTTGKLPALSISFVTGDGKARRGGDWVAIPMHLFKEYFE